MSNNPTLQMQLYTAHATAIGEREGSVKTDDGKLALDVALPAALGGKGGNGTNPEQLFAAGYAERAQAERLVAAPHQVTYSNATRGNIHVDVKVRS